jgi:AbrB family looped-hinge helix DNA binding protein
MAETRVSTKFQVVIPKEAREQVHVEPGQRLSVIVKGGIIHLVPVPTIAELQRQLRGMNTQGLREEVDER